MPLKSIYSETPLISYSFNFHTLINFIEVQGMKKIDIIKYIHIQIYFTFNVSREVEALAGTIICIYEIILYIDLIVSVIS